MNIDETLSYIHAVCWRSSIPGLERIRALLALMGDPQKDMKFIHVTGTNGKGSTCAIMASILRAAGYRTGLYTSPFLIRFNERMQVDGRQITDDELCEITAQVRPLADSLDPHPTSLRWSRPSPSPISPGTTAISWCARWAWAANLTPPT